MNQCLIILARAIKTGPALLYCFATRRIIRKSAFPNYHVQPIRNWGNMPVCRGKANHLGRGYSTRTGTLMNRHGSFCVTIFVHHTVWQYCTVHTTACLRKKISLI